MCSIKKIGNSETVCYEKTRIREEMAVQSTKYRTCRAMLDISYQSSEIIIIIIIIKFV